MDYLELKNKLNSNSPFVLKPQLEQKDYLDFKDALLLLNNETIGRYDIEEEEHYYRIECSDGALHLKTPMMIILDFKLKPIVLICGDKRGQPELESEFLDSLPKLIPLYQFIADEKAEL